MRNSLIDVGKFIAAILVVLIHTALFDEAKTLIGQFDSILRLAVPFFIICSGYYIGKSLEVVNERVLTNDSNKRCFLSFFRKMCSIYFIWSLVYLVVYIPSWIESGWFSVGAFVDWGIATVLQGSYYHLWYILYMIYAVIALALIVKIVPINRLPIVAILLYITEVVQYGYSMLLPRNIQNIFVIFDYIDCLSSITRVLPLLMLGVYISKTKAKYEKINIYFIGFVFSFLCLIVERNILASYGQDSVSYIFLTLPTSYFMFRLLVESKYNIKLFDTKILSKVSTYIYLIHPIFIVVLGYIQINSEWMSALITILLSIISSYFIVLCRKRL